MRKRRRKLSVYTASRAGTAESSVMRLSERGKSSLDTQIYKYIMYRSNTTDLNMFVIVLGQHVSTLIESSSGPSKIQILINNV